MSQNSFPFLIHGGLKYYLYILDWIERESSREKIDLPENLAVHLRKEHVFPRLWSNFLTSFPYQLTAWKTNEDGGFTTTANFNAALNRVIENLELGIHPSVMLSGYREQRFSKELETLAPDTLYHFVPREYMFQTIQYKKLFPTNANVFEYHFGGPQDNFKILKEIFLETQTLLNNAKIHEDLSLLIEKIKTPIFSCFTSIPKESLSFHISHYGSMGIGFKRDNLIEKFSAGRRSKFGPVRYIGNRASVVFNALLEAYKLAPTEEAKKELISELLFFKALPIKDFKKESLYSSYFEYEWRYISTEKPFEFEYSDVSSIIVDKMTYELHTQRDFNSMSSIRWIAEIFNVAAKHGIKVIPFEPFSSQNSSDTEILRSRDQRIDEVLASQTKGQK